VNTPEGQRVKLIRNESIGSYSWSYSSDSVNRGYGLNEWSVSSIKNILNEGAYYNRVSGDCVVDKNNLTSACDFSKIGLTEEAKKYIDTITWNLGSQGEINDNSLFSTNHMYSYERSNHTGKACTEGDDCNDDVIRNVVWQGQVGLMYPSDYGYAMSGKNDISRSTCLSTSLYTINEETYAE